MKAVYIGLLLLICLQTLIGSSDGRWNGRTCSEITCADNERCYEQEDNNYFTYSCLCSENYYREDSTDRCVSKYPFVKFTPELSNDSRLVVNEESKYYLDVVARLNYNNGNKRPCHGIINLDKRTISIYPSIPQENATKEVIEYHKRYICIIMLLIFNRQIL
ncbi:hypothetical protein PV328_004228 [Microctonus aethiopoides]|uniref:EGF-like domain-containing protein n=1 Tax=Microctonus aethiopoides TaxID=144406 RepID=A0AA39KLC6_9HYME|nr:hypothetical protein PV328_004228 [Microctonus aethiopoides]